MKDHTLNLGDLVPMLKRFLVASVLSGVLAVASVGAVLGHECVISSRSDQGDAGATHSSRWMTLTLADVLTFIIPGEVGGPSLTPDQLQWALDNRGDIPLSWTTRSDKTIAEGSSDPNLADGKGLDHLADLYGPQVGSLYFAALQQ
jgi:hypothetical protein